LPEFAAPPVADIRLPWGAWFGDHDQALPVPADWTIETLGMTDSPSLSPSAIEAALDQPIGAPPVAQLVQPSSTVAIAIDDLTRPTPTAPLVAGIVRRLEQAGVALSRIRIVVASGAHRVARTSDVALKIGSDLAQRLEIVPHDPHQALTDTGVTLSGTPVHLCPAFVQAEVRIGIGCVIPHPFAGFSGGGKVVIPGLASFDTLARTHKFALMGMNGGGTLDTNKFRREMERAVREIGLHWSVNVVVNSRREIAHVRAGDLVEAHRAAAADAAALGTTPAPDGLLDALVLNTYPKDGEFLQVEAAFVSLRSGMLPWLAPGAPIVLVAACPGGLGEHGMFQPGGRLFRVPSKKTFLGEHPLIVFCPTVEEEQARTVFWPGYPFHRSWNAVVDDLRARLSAGARIGIVPCGPLQLAAGSTARV
jgi:nickel-dependent lactate racemase